MRHLRNLLRPSASVEARLAEPDCERKLAQVLAEGGSAPSEFEEAIEEITQGGCFQKRVMSELKTALTGLEICARLLERGEEADPEFLDKIFKGDTRTELANGCLLYTSPSPRDS